MNRTHIAPKRLNLAAPTWLLAVLAAIVMGMAIDTTALAAPAHKDATAAVREALNQSAVAWSAGDLDAFMRVYEDSPQTTYIAAKGPVTGYREIHDMYAARFSGAKPVDLGALTFDILDTHMMGPAYALVVGRFHLTHADGSKPPASGIFTLVFHRSAAGWRIISDHTS